MFNYLKEYLLPYFSYPLVLMLALFLQHRMLENNLNIQVSSFAPVIMGAIIIAILEFVIPYHKKWHPRLKELRTDISYTIFVQILLPKLLGFLVVIGILEHVQHEGLVIESLWPHQWHVVFQVMAMMIIAEFLRYWLHRAAHTWKPLWRLHAVHHSPKKLYWLNTSRFHPLEKGIQFLFDSLPFIFLGVSAEVLSIYFVFYALNGFFQHSNINLRMGFLNYIISSAELHRWHHSKLYKQSGNNFGNNLIIWDIIFGSRFLPNNQKVQDLGLYNRAYPMTFTKQMMSPLTPGIEHEETLLLGIKDIYMNCKVKVGVLLAKFIYRIPFEASLASPAKYQQKVLTKIIGGNQHTAYGKAHGFDRIIDHKSFIENIPIQQYEHLQKYIEEQELTKQNCLTDERPIFYAATSGTTGKPKYIPVLKTTLKQHKKSLAIFATVQSNVAENAFGGRLLAIPGAYREGVMKGESTYGAISGLLYYLMPHYLQNKYIVPNEIFGLQDYELKYRLIVRLAIQHPNISYMVSANPSTFLKLIDIVNEELGSLADELEAGSFKGIDKLPSEVRKITEGLLISSKERATLLRELKNKHTKIQFSDLWPNLKLVVTWTCGSTSIAVRRLKEILSKQTQILELGYLSSEFRGTITFEDTGSSGVPTIHDNYYEFIESKDYEKGVRETLQVNQLDVGKQYYIIITTPAGLYRYFMNDIIEVTGYRKNTPLIRFVQKGKGVTNITGEKLSEQQLMMAVEEINKEKNISIPFYIALTKVESSHYILYLEADIDTDEYSLVIDEKLQILNSEYQSKRASGRLNPLIARCLKLGTGEKYKSFSIANGCRESQFKYLLLQNEDDCNFPFDKFII